MRKRLNQFNTNRKVYMKQMIRMILQKLEAAIKEGDDHVRICAEAPYGNADDKRKCKWEKQLQKRLREPPYCFHVKKDPYILNPCWCGSDDCDHTQYIVSIP